MPTYLKPCPFCGKTPVLSGDKKIRWIVCPSDSPCSGSGMAMGIAANDVERGIEAWNTRSDAVSQGEIARLRGALDEIGALCRHLRHGGPDPMDLESLSDALTTAVDTAADALK